MASRTVALGPARALALVIAALVPGSAAMLALHAEGFRLTAQDLAALRFTVMQAGLSAVIAAGLAVPLARALFRRRFAGRAVLIRLLAAPFVLPVVVAVLGILAVLGRAGPVNQLLATLGLAPVSIFGLPGILLANVFFNLPLATRMLLQGWQAIPAERFRLAAALALPPVAQFRHLEAPMLRGLVPGIVLTVFLICLGSFAIALMLGGGPAASTLELAIYQALRFDFDLGRAALLALQQFAVCAGVTLLAARAAILPGFGAGLDRPLAIRPLGGWRRGLDGLVILLAALFLLAPMVAVVARGLPGMAALPEGLWPAALRSVIVATVSAFLALAAALVLAEAAARSRQGWIDVVAMAPLAASALVLGTGLFLALHGWASPDLLALPVVVVVNATMALPYLYRLLLPPCRQLWADHGRLIAALGLGPATVLWRITLPRLARPLGYGAGLAAALSMGDLGAVALFAGERGVTLPLFVQRLMGAYRMEAAAAAALVLVGLSLALFWLFDRMGDRDADA